jgi:hypothetical protein
MQVARLVETGQLPQSVRGLRGSGPVQIKGHGAGNLDLAHGNAGRAVALEHISLFLVHLPRRLVRRRAWNNRNAAAPPRSGAMCLVRRSLV